MSNHDEIAVNAIVQKQKYIKNNTKDGTSPFFYPEVHKLSKNYKQICDHCERKVKIGEITIYSNQSVMSYNSGLSPDDVSVIGNCPHCGNRISMINNGQLIGTKQRNKHTDIAVVQLAALVLVGGYLLFGNIGKNTQGTVYSEDTQESDILNSTANSHEEVLVEDESANSEAANSIEEVTIIVNETTEPVSISLSSSTLSLNRGGTAQLMPQVSNQKDSDETITWSSSDTGVVSVSDGTVKGVGDGTATVTAKIGTVAAASCVVTVKTVYDSWIDGTASDPDAETRTLYRYRDNAETFELSSYPKNEGVLDHADVSYSEYTDWSDSYIASSDTVEVETREVVSVPGHYEYRYWCWEGASGGHSFCNKMAENLYGAPVVEKTTAWSTERFPEVDHLNRQCPGGSGHIHNNGISNEKYGLLWNVYKKDGVAYYSEESRWVEDTFKTQYRSRNKYTTYYYYVWNTGDWSEWSETPYTPNGQYREVQYKEQYRQLITK